MATMPSLTRAEAADRAALLSVDGYTVDLDLTTGPELLGCTTGVRLRCARPGAATLGVDAPPDWTVLANAAGTQVTPGCWRFAATPPLSTYLVTLVAGVYHSRHDEHDGVPLGLHCRAALAEHLDRDADELFGITAG